MKNKNKNVAIVEHTSFVRQFFHPIYRKFQKGSYNVISLFLPSFSVTGLELRLF